MRISTDVAYGKSCFVQVVEQGNNAIIWHSLFGNAQVVSSSVVGFLESFKTPETIQSLGAQYEITPETEEIIATLISNRFLVPDGFDERQFLAERMREREQPIVDGSLIDYLELIMSEECNFRCTYCIHFANLGNSERIDDPRKFMSLPSALKSVEEYLTILRRHNKRTAEINFGGGEPLLAWKVVKQVLEYCTREHDQEFEFRFSINTNASLITPEIARDLRDYKVSVAISLDGVGEFNDRVRIKVMGQGTFNNIVRGIDALAGEDYPIDGVAVTVNEANFEGINEELVEWARRRGMTELRIDIDVINMVNVHVDDIVNRLVTIKRHAKKAGIEVVGFWSRAFENLNFSSLEDRIAFCGAVRGNSMCINPSGKIYGCGYSTTQLGDLVQIESFSKPEGNYHRFVRDHLTGAMEMCRGCMIESQCGGGCNITQEFARAAKTAKIERMCDFYRAMTRELALEQLQALAL